jgi:methoxymalonate biosynthesis protein
MKIKCLVWDLDNTLWQGTLSENPNVIFREETRDILKKIDELGILQSIASRNNLDQVIVKLDEIGIRDFFLYPQCHWGSKVESIKRIAEKLNIGIDTIGYIDDNPFELAEVKYFLPDVRTYNAKEYADLLSKDEFKCENVTREGSMRRQMMISRLEREQAEESFKGTREDFLRECRMELTVRLARTNDVDRIYELASRTNQMNNMLERISRDTIVRFMESEDKLVYTAQLTDRFGYHGIVGACLLEKREGCVYINLFCISCRVEGRGIGAGFLGTIINRLTDTFTDISEVYCHYVDEKKNRPALMLLNIVGFVPFMKEGNKSTYVLKLPVKKPDIDWLKIVAE